MARGLMGCVAGALLALLVGAVGCAQMENCELDVPEAVSVSRPDAEAPVVIVLNGPKKAVRVGKLFVVAVQLEVEAGYEIHARHAAAPSIATKLELKLPQGFEATGDWSGPEATESMTQDGQRVYEGLVVFTREVRVGKNVQPGTFEVGCTVSYQACGPTRCLRPVERTLTVRGRVE